MIQTIDLQIIQQLPTPIAILNQKKELQYTSNVWEKEFETSTKNKAKNTISDLLNTEKSKWIALLDACLNGDSGSYKAQTIANPNKWYQFNCSPFTNDLGETTGICIQAQDISSTVHYSSKLQETGSVLNEVLQKNQLGKWTFKVKDNQLTWDDITRSIYGVTPQYKPSLQKLLGFISEDHTRSRIQRLFNQALKKSISWDETIEILTAKGKTNKIQIQGKSLANPKGVHTLLGTVHEIEKTVMNNLNLMENKLLLGILNQLPFNIYIKDRHHRRTYINNNEMHFLGLEESKKAIGKTDLELLPNHIALQNIDHDNKVFNHNQGVFEHTIKISKNKNEEAVYKYLKIALKQIDKNCNQLLSIGIDEKTKKSSEQELKNSIRTVKKQEKRLRNFTHIVSHNLRSHAANFSMLLDMLDPEMETSSSMHIYQMLKKSSDTLLETIANLNDMSSITHIPIHKRKSIFLKQVCEEVINQLQDIIETQQAKIEIRIPKEVKILATKPYLHNILYNIISNALRYKHPSRASEIMIEHQQTKKYQVVKITDNGLGIDLLRNKHKLFGMYKIFHNHPDAKGFGLFLTKAQIDAINGKVTVESKVDVGTTFKVYFNEEN